MPDARRNQQNQVPNIDLSDSNLTVEEEDKVMKLVEKYSDILARIKGIWEELVYQTRA